MNAAVNDCIWCKRPVRKTNIEHILPESLGCPPQFVLQGCVCMSCNNSLGHVDQALLKQFEIVAFMHGVPRKGGGRRRLTAGQGSEDAVATLGLNSI